MGSSQAGRDVPYVQEFEFAPGSEYAHDIEKLELIMQLEPEGVHVLVEVIAGPRVSRLAGN